MEPVIPVVPTQLELEGALAALQVPDSLRSQLTAFGDAVQAVAETYDRYHRVPAPVILAAVRVAATRLEKKDDDLKEIAVTCRPESSAGSGEIRVRVARVPVPDEQAARTVSFFFVRPDEEALRGVYLYCIVLDRALVELVEIRELPTDVEKLRTLKWWSLPPQLEWADGLGVRLRNRHEATVIAAIAWLTRSEARVDSLAEVARLTPLTPGVWYYEIAARRSADTPLVVIEVISKSDGSWHVQGLREPVDPREHGDKPLASSPLPVPQRVYLARRGITTVRALLMRPPGAYPRITPVGNRSVDLLTAWLKELGIDWTD